MTISQRLSEIRHGFSSSFWIANTLELFERLAFYGAKAVLTFYLANKVGLVNDAGKLAGIFSGLIFLLPILAGVIVDRYGFRKSLIACFLIFCIGYFLIGLAGLSYGASLVQFFGAYNYSLIVLILTAIGGSLIKPCIVGTVSKTSKPDARAFGFSIYYTLVNLGGAFGPIIAMNIRKDLGIEYVLIMSSVTTFLLCIGTLIFFKEPESEDGSVVEQRTFGKVFKDMLLVFGNFKFISFLVIFSGFWLMFWQIYYLVPFYGTEVLKFEDFELLETVDAVCIIVLTVPMTILASKLKPIVAITLGLFVSSFSWILIGAFGTTWATIAGIGLFAMGESIQAPRFYEYVSNLAPKEQIGTFMGFAFLPIAIGSFGAGIISDWLRLNYLSTQPALMWYLVALIGIASTLLMIVFNRIVAKRTN
jgi:dipeptide/tripeptide permease